MDGKLLARNILCALGTGVIINLGISTTAYASENQNDYSEKQNVVVSDNTQQRQMERIRQISQEIADINARLSQLTEELNRYNEQLNTAQIDDNPQIDIDNIESFNENRQLEKQSRISSENTQEFANDFNTVSDAETVKSDNSIQDNSDIAGEKKSEPIQITSRQIHQKELIQNNLSDNKKKIEQSASKPKERYIAENRDTAINNERKNILFNYDENGFKTGRIPSYSTAESRNLNTSKTVQINDVQNMASSENNTVNVTNKKDGAELFSTDNRTVPANSNINENRNINMDSKRGDAVLTSNEKILATNEIENRIENIADKRQNSFMNGKKNNLNYGLQQEQKKYISSEYINRNRNISRVQQNSGVQIERNEESITENEDNVIEFKKITMLDRFNASAPSWTYEYFSNLDKAGLLYPDKDFNLNNLSRREGAILTARSYNLYKIQSRRNQYVTNGNNKYNRDTTIINDINILMKEFSQEVKALGYDVISEVSDTDIAYTTDYNWKIGGEIRYNYAKNGGSSKYDWDESRVRARLYGKKALSDNWNINVMLETDHNFLGNDDNLYSKSDDTDLDLSRIYVDGQMNWWDIPFYIELGKTYAYLGEGNVLDSDLEGLKIAANPDPDTLYSAGYGQVNDTEDMFYLEAYHKNRQYDYLAGFYRWDNYGNPANIYALGMNYYTGDFKLGGMYLKSDLADGSGAQDGYVLSARYKEVFPWIPNTYEFDLKYYNMAGNTYINHTMNGVGSYMDGFSGWGAMAYYALAENWLLGLEYYDLKDKTTGEKGRTAWVQLSWYF